MASEDSKQLEDSKPVSNGTLSEDSKSADVPTNHSKLLEEGKPVDAPTADSTLPIHRETRKELMFPSPLQRMVRLITVHNSLDDAYHVILSRLSAIRPAK